MFASRFPSTHQRAWRAGVLLIGTTLTALAVGTARAQTPPDWVTPIAATQGVGLALDAANNSYVVGTEINRSSQPVSIFGDNFAIVVGKVTPAGALGPLKSSARSSQAYGVALDRAGNVIVAGSTVDTTRTVDGGLIQKYDAALNLLWEAVRPAQYGRTWQALPDAAGNIYAAESSATGFAVAKYSAAGALLWTRALGATAGGATKVLAVTSGGHVLASANTGVFALDGAGNTVWSKAISGSDVSVMAGPAGEVFVFADALAIRHDTAYNELWRANLGAPPEDAAIDASGGLATTGRVVTPSGVLTVVAYDWLTTKVGPAGNVLWQRQHGAAAWTFDQPKGVAVSGDGSVYVTGNASTTTAAGVRGVATTVKYAPDGTQQWLVTDALAQPNALGVRLSSDGGVVVHSSGTPFTTPATTPHVVARYSATGLPNQAPVAMASASTSAGPAPLTVTLRSTGSNDADGVIAGYAWTLGDGRTSTDANPVVSYATPGQYTAQLTVTDTVGASSAPAGVTITVNTPVVAPKPQSLTLARTSVPQRSSTTATLTATGNAGVTVKLTSSNTSAATVPSSVTIPAGATSVSFKVTTLRVRRDTAVTISATANGATVSAALTVAR